VFFSTFFLSSLLLGYKIITSKVKRFQVLKILFFALVASSSIVFFKKKDQRDSMSAFYSSFYESQFDFFYIGLNFLFKLFELLLVFA